MRLGVTSGKRRWIGARFGVAVAGALALGGCGAAAETRRDATPAIVAVDADGATLTLARPAKRVVALIPSATETIVALGGTDLLVGRTTYDVLPELQHLPLLGGGLDASVERIVALRPDLLIAWDGGKNARTRRDLAGTGIPFFSIHAQDTADVFHNVEVIGKLIGRDSAATALNAKLRRELEEVRRSVEGLPRPRVFYVVWNDPPMTAGPRTFIGQLFSLAGAESIFPDADQNWLTVGLEQVVRRQPDIVILPTGEMAARTNEELAALPGWGDMRAVREGRVIRVPVDITNRPGPRIAEAARLLRDSLHIGSAVR